MNLVIRSISVSGDGSTIVVGAVRDDDNGSGSGSAYISGSGSAYIFDRDGNELAKLTASDGSADDFFGNSISVSGDGSTIVVGAYLDDDNGSASGSAYIFDRDGNELAKLTASDGAANDLFGNSISVSNDGSTIVVGAERDDDNGLDSGSAYTFIRNEDGNYVDDVGNIYGPSGIIGQAVEGQVTTSGTLTIADADAGEAFFQEIVGTGGDNGLGTFELSTDGNWTFTLDNSNPAVQALGAGETATETITATSFDGSATQLIEVTIEGSNDDPTVAAALSVADVSEDDAPVILDLLDGASDVDNSDVLVATGIVATFIDSDNNTGSVTFTDNNDGTISVDPNQFNALGAGDSADVTVSYTIEDGNGGSVAQTATFTVIGANDAPVAADGTIEVVQDTPFDGQLNASDPDGDTTSFTAETIDTANGTVVINSDGSYTYTPDTGFVGVDTFTPTAVDPAGATDTAEIRVEVENESSTSPSGQDVTISISGDSVDGNPYGNLSFALTSFNAPNINLAFGLDGSGSIGEEAWSLTVGAIANTIDDLAARLANSPVQVDIHIFQFAGTYNTPDILTLDTDDTNDTPVNNGENLFKFDLQTDSATIVAELANYPYLGGSTPWSDAFKQARKFFRDEPTDETNLFYFVSDGNPYSYFQPWETQLERLKNQPNLEIQAFGVGTAYTPSILSQVDSDGQPTEVLDFDDLQDAFSTSGLFPAELVDFSLSLVADGVDYGEIADETSSGLVQDTSGFDLAIANIEGIEDLLGETNEFAVSATIDFDGDINTTADQIVLNSFEAINVGSQSVTVAGTTGDDLIVGSSENDDLSGDSGNDLIFAAAGDDQINGQAGDDILIGGAGEDTFYFETGDGLDTITDYDVMMDEMTFGTGIEFADLTIAQDGADVTVAYGADMVTVENQNVADFTVDEFNFV